MAKLLHRAKRFARRRPVLVAAGIGVAVVTMIALLGRRLHTSQVKRKVEAESMRQGLDPGWALAWVDLETGGTFRADLIGDRDWPFRSCRQLRGCYEEDVLNNPAYDGNPYRLDRSAWISYGLFQLLSPFNLDDAVRFGLLPEGSHPSALLDPDVNTALGVTKVLRLAERTDGDFVRSRLIAAGCGREGACDPEVKDRIASRALGVAREYGIA